AMPLRCGGTHTPPSLSVNEVLQVGVSKVSCPVILRPVAGSVKPIGSESTAIWVGAARLAQVDDNPLAGQLSLNFTKSDWRPDVYIAVSLSQLSPMDGSPAFRPRYSTPLGCCPASVVL